MTKNEDFYKVLFDQDEHTCFGVSPFDTQSYEIAEGVNHPTTKFFTINPLIKGRTRKFINVKKHRNLLFEIDNIPVPEQVEKIKNSALPFSTAVFSGGKSVHWIVSLNKELTDRVEYTAVWKACHAALLKYEVDADTATKDPARLSRCPGVMRDNGKEQKLLKVVGRISFEELNNWLIRNDINWEDYLPSQDFNTGSEGVSSAEDKLKIEWIEKYYMKNDEYKKGNQHHYQIKLAYSLLRTGMDASSIDRYIINKYGEVSTGIGSVAKLDTSSLGESIYVPTMEERKAHYRTLEAEQNAEANRERFASEVANSITVVKEADEESINRYLTVGTEYYKKDAESDLLLRWNKTMFEKIYGSGSLPPRMYDAFSYEPNYISSSFPYDLGARGQLRNRFVRPSYDITQGEWPTIKSALQYAFGDQYELALKYCALLLKYPKQNLPLIWFVGPENTGKSAIIKIFELLVGMSNSKRVKGSDLENDFNGYLMDIQLLIIEESGGWKNPIAVMNDIKDLVTSNGKIFVNPKYGVQQDYPFYGKVMMSTNNYEDIPMEGQATRIWAVELSGTPPKVKDYYTVIENEMGAFAYDLLNTISIQYPREPRLYFDPSEYMTETKRFLQDLSSSEMYNAIDSIIADWFDKFPEETECYFDLKSLKIELMKYVRIYKMKLDVSDKNIKTCLKKEFGIERTNKLTRPDSLEWKPSVGDIPADREAERRSQWFVLERTKVLGEDSIFDTTKILA